MPARALQFPPYLQAPLEQGLLTPRQAWLWERDQEQFLEPWTPEGLQLQHLLVLFHWEPNRPPQ